jgi:ZIP family zinc transporter
MIPMEMAEAFDWGLLASSSLVLGGILALKLPIGRRTLGLIMAFGAAF